MAGQYADTVWLGVGLHNGYGSAQRMYIKRGYIPDGIGVWYQGRSCEQYETEIGRKKIIQSPSNNDWGVRVSAFTIVKCADCGVCFYRDANGNVVETK